MVDLVEASLDRPQAIRYYYDGMMWSSLFVPWRGAKEDHIVKVSGIGGVMRLGYSFPSLKLRSDIRPPLMPPWWCLLPPPVRVLRGLYWQGPLSRSIGPSPGYLDALLWFRTAPRQWLGAKTTAPRPAVRPEGFCGRRERETDAAVRPSAQLRKWQVAKELMKRTPPKLAKAQCSQVSCSPGASNRKQSFIFIRIPYTAHVDQRHQFLERGASLGL